MLQIMLVHVVKLILFTLIPLGQIRFRIHRHKFSSALYLDLYRCAYNLADKDAGQRLNSDNIMHE